MVVIDILRGAATPALLIVTALVVREALRPGGRVIAGTLAAGAASLTLLNILGLVNRLLPEPSAVARDLSIVLLAASGYAMFSYRGTVFPLRRWSRPVAGAALALAGALTLVELRLEPRSASADARWLLVVVWAVCLLEPAWRFWGGTRARSPVDRARWRLLAVGFAGAVVVVVEGAARPTSSNTAIEAGTRVVVLGLVAAFGLAVSPPLRLRRWWLQRASRREAREFLPIGTWYWDIATDLVVWNSILHTWSGTDARTFRADFSAFLEHIHPDDRERVEAIVREHADSTEPFEFDHRFVSSAGAVRWLHCRGSVVTDPSTGRTEAMFGTATDITDRKRAGIETERSEELFRSLVSSAPDASIAVDSAGRIVLVNDAATTLFGYRQNELVGRTVDILLPERIRSVHAQHRREYMNDPRRRPMGKGRDLRARRSDGSDVDVDISLAPVETLQGTLVVVSLRDVTERRRAERAIADALARSTEASEHLRRVDEMKNAFLEAVSHELRTPLTAVLGLGATILRRPVLESPQHVAQLAERIVANGERLERLLSDLLDLDRLTRGTLEPNRRSTDLRALVLRTLTHIETDGHPIELDLAEVTADVSPPQVERIVENLVVNAIRHTPPGTPISVGLHLVDDDLELTVEDRGPGVRDALKDSIFEPFSRGESAAARVGGSGIGLSLVARFAQLHGGRAWVQDRDGEGGASFRVRLPIAIDEPEITSGAAGAPLRSRETQAGR